MFDFGSLFGGIGSFFGGRAEASGYRAAAADYTEAARITKLSGGLKNLAAQRQIYQLGGAAKATQGASGFGLSGSALDVIHSNTQQGYLTKALGNLQSNMEYNAYLAQASQARAAADTADTSSIFGLIGGIAGFFSDDTLKKDIQFIGRRGDGLGIYDFRFKGTDDRYTGVLASEVEVLFPNAVHMDGGYKRIDYDSLGVEFKRAA